MKTKLLFLLIILLVLVWAFFEVKKCTPYTETEPGLSVVGYPKGKRVKICFYNLVFKSTKVGVPFKIRVYKDGYLLKDKFLRLNIYDLVQDNKQHDYLVEILDIHNKRLLLSSAVVLFGINSENTVQIDWLGGRPDVFDIYSFAKIVGFEKLKYVVKKNPFEGVSEINSVVLLVSKGDMEIVDLTIYPKDKNIQPLIFKGLNNPYLIIKYDATFNANSFLWDDAFTTWFSLNLNPDLVKNTLDFWYSLQIKNGENKGLIPREVRVNNYPDIINKGLLSEEINPISIHPLTSNQVIGPYILSKVELEFYNKNHDLDRLKKIIDYQIKYFDWVEKHKVTRKFIERVNRECPIYSSSNFGSGMDNSPRGGKDPGNYGWFDLAAQQVALAGDIAQIAKITGDAVVYQRFGTTHENLKGAVQACYFDYSQSFWFDILSNGDLDIDNPTAAGFWGIYAGLATKPELNKVVNSWITNSKKFGGFPPLPSLPRDSLYFQKDGEYWRGGEWPPLWWIVIYGLKQSGFNTESDRIFGDVMQTLNEVFEKTGTIFEYYSPSVDVDGTTLPGKFNKTEARKDFLGWGKLPLMYSPSQIR